MRRVKSLLAVALAATLAGCNKEDPAQLAADGKATGAACRHAGRAIEDCFAMNADALRGAVFEGWKEMNDYMRENKIAEVQPQEKPKAQDEAHADAGHGEGSAEHGEAADTAHAEAGAEDTKVAAAEHGEAATEDAGAHAAEGEKESAAGEAHADPAEEKH